MKQDKLSNLQIYGKTLPIFLLGFVIDLFALAIMAGTGTGGYFIFGGNGGMAIFGLIIGLVVGGVLAFLFSAFVGNIFHAAAIAITEKALLENTVDKPVVSNGLKLAKSRFGSITGFFFLSSGIKAAFRQLGRAITGFGGAVGGQAGSSVGGAIDSAIQSLVGYLSDCCLAWVFYRSDSPMGKSAVEGCAIFFRSGKTFARNAGRIFGISFASFIVIGGALFGLYYLLTYLNPGMLKPLTDTFAGFADDQGNPLPEFFTNPYLLGILAAGLAALINWSIFHTAFVKPFILVGVMRNFLKTGLEQAPTEAEVEHVKSISPRISRFENR